MVSTDTFFFDNTNVSVDSRYPDKMENGQKAGDTPEMIEIQTFEVNSQNDLHKNGTRKKIDNDVCVDANIKSEQCTISTSSGEPTSILSLSSTNRQDSILIVPTDQQSVPKNNGSSSIPHTAVIIIEKQPPTYVILSAVSFFINPLCGAMAIWQSCKF